MSTAPSHLYAVPPPTGRTDPRNAKEGLDQLSRMGWLLRARQAARRAFDLALALPRGAAQWALRHVQSASGMFRSIDLPGLAGGALRAAKVLGEQVGAVPLGLTIVTAPPVQRLLAHGVRTGLRWAGALLRRTWAATSAAIARTGSPGRALLNTLDRWTSQARTVASRVAAHPAVPTVVATVRRALGAVAPLVRMVSLHRLLATLIPTRWARALVETAVMPVLVTAVVPATLLAPMTARGKGTTMACDLGSQDLAGEGVSHVEDESLRAGEPIERADVMTVDTDRADEGLWPASAQPTNRAERRAMQREQARARRAAPGRPSAS
ncbi:hypothetical protein GCM10009814_14520 [Lapillicoccus jejuensis]